MSGHVAIRRHWEIWRLRERYGWGSRRISAVIGLSEGGVTAHLYKPCKCVGRRWKSKNLTPIDWRRGDHDRKCAACHRLFAVDAIRFKGSTKWPICHSCRCEGWTYGRSLGRWYLNKVRAKAGSRADGCAPASPFRDAVRANRSLLRHRTLVLGWTHAEALRTPITRGHRAGELPNILSCKPLAN